MIKLGKRLNKGSIRVGFLKLRVGNILLHLKLASIFLVHFFLGLGVV